MAVEREFGGFVVDLATFAGPLDLLLHLIRREEVDILDIPIAGITDQFLAALEGMRENRLEVTGEFLVVAATLLQIKSRMVLPRPPASGDEEADDPRRELVELLLEYQHYREAAGLLDELALVRRQQFAVPAEGLATGPPPLAQVSLTALLQAYSVLLSKLVPPPAPRLREERFNLQQQAARILERLASGAAEFGELFGRQPSRQEVVFTFMALLELVRDGRVAAAQDLAWGPIRLWRVPDAAVIEPN